MDALERFRKEFKGWVISHNQAKDFKTDPDEILVRLENKIPEPMLRQIGAAFIIGWLQNEPEADRRYFVRESDTSKEWAFWKRDEKTLNLQNEDPLEIARMVAAVIYPL